MRRRAIPAIVIFLFLAGLGVILRHDLALLAWRQGNDLLRAGDYHGAVAFLHRADCGTPNSLPIAFDTGVALYRLEDFQQARARFVIASASDDLALRGAARYNLGNCAFRQGEKVASADRQAARRFFQEAAREYEQTLVIAPGAADARHNLAVVRKRLADLGVDAGRDARSNAAQSGNERAGNGDAKSGKEGKEARRGGESATGRRAESSKETAGRSPGDKSDAPAHSGKAQPKLTRDEAERLVNEARGGKTMSAALPAKGDRGRLARPDKDW
jgi:hypothetical protein